jgi:peptide/nickel transport system ATP-binding protein
MAGTGTAHMRGAADPLLTVEDLVVEFPTGPKQIVHAVSGISFDVLEGETLGIVGESGCGKSTSGRAIMQLPPPTSGRVVLGDSDLTTLSSSELRRTRTKLQMIFQDPISSLNPRRRVREIVGRGLEIWGADDSTREARVDEVLEAVGLDPVAVSSRRPHEFSGGQCQRICIARALVLEPKVIICDEPVSALDVSVQAQILNLLEEMKHRYGLTLVFIAHDLAVVKNVSDRVLVMYLGKVCEVGSPDAMYSRPAHHYTKVLLESIPEPKARRGQTDTAGAEMAGELPSPIDPPSGCRFRTRCPAADERCAKEEPALRAVGENHFVACHHPLSTSAPATLNERGD